MADDKVLEIRLTEDDGGSGKQSKETAKANKEAAALLEKLFKEFAKSEQKREYRNSRPIKEYADSEDGEYSWKGDTYDRKAFERELAALKREREKENSPEFKAKQQKLWEKDFEAGLNKLFAGMDSVIDELLPQFETEWQKFGKLFSSFSVDLTSAQKAFSGFLHGEKEATAALFTLVGEAAPAALALGAFTAVTYASIKAIEELTETYKRYSAAVAVAAAQTQIKEIEDRLKIGKQAGGDIAALENQRSDILSELRQIVGLLVQIFEPALNAIMQGIDVLLTIIRKILEWIEFAFALAEKATEWVVAKLAEGSKWIPVLGSVMRSLQTWLEKDNNDQGTDFFEEKNRDLFGEAGKPFEFHFGDQEP